MGIDFLVAKAIGTFANGITTSVTTVSNIIKGMLDYKLILPLLFLSIIFSSIGAFSSNIISENIVKIIFVIFILISIVLIFINTMLVSKTIKQNNNYLLFYVVPISFVSGLLGVGGGILYLPLFIYLGIQIKKSIVTISALIPFVSFSAFLTYSTFVDIDYVLLFCVACGAIIGGYIGNKIMYKIKNEKYLKYFLSVILLLISFEMIFVNVME